MAAKLRQPITVETLFDRYVLHEQIGEGGAGRVYGGRDTSGTPIALKVLSQTSTDKRRRFKNEVAFLAKCSHRNVVQLIDEGFSQIPELPGPFYVMNRFTSSLRGVLKTSPPATTVLPLFLQLLDGAEAAHLMGAIHRDLKPENILWDEPTKLLAVADFGVASLSPDLVATAIETKPGTRLANAVYAAPEQFERGAVSTLATDIYPLGLILNEMFTGQVPRGHGYKTIASVAADFAYLDDIVASMIAQSQADRPQSIAKVKAKIELLGEQQIARQKISDIDQTVIRVGDIDNPLARVPPQVTHARYEDGVITIELDRPTNREWVDVLQNHHGPIAYHIHPNAFQFSGRTVRVAAPTELAQQIVNQFKTWLPQATQILNSRLECNTLARNRNMKRACVKSGHVLRSAFGSIAHFRSEVTGTDVGPALVEA